MVSGAGMAGGSIWQQAHNDPGTHRIGDLAAMAA
jgi:hypothetical protein